MNPAELAVAELASARGAFGEPPRRVCSWAASVLMASVWDLESLRSASALVPLTALASSSLAILLILGESSVRERLARHENEA